MFKGVKQSNNPELNHELYNLYTTYIQKNYSIRNNYSYLIKNFNGKTRIKWRDTLFKYASLLNKKFCRNLMVF